MACSSILDIGKTRHPARTRALAHARVPTYAMALLESLQFCDPDTQWLESLSEAEWHTLLAFADSRQLTLLLGSLCGSALPDWVEARIGRNYRSARKRFERLNAALFEISDALESRHIEFVLLKAHAHCPSFTPDPVLRAQGDIDLWCIRGRVFDAREALLELGYLPQSASNGRHLAPLVRPTKWSWTGDYFAPDLPIPVDLHYALWDVSETSLAGPAEHEFWNRREWILVAGRKMLGLSETDTLAFAALHLLMHLFGGDLRLQRAWEIARFLHTRAHDDQFWHKWQLLHSPESRQLQAIAFSLSANWFGSRISHRLLDEEHNFPGDVKLWMERYSLRPLESLFNPRKDELWLHLSLLASKRDKLRIFVRRLIPIRLPTKHANPDSSSAARTETGERMMEWQFRLSRFAHHLRTLFPTLAGAIKWWWLRQGLGRDFLTFQLSSAFFDFGEFIFFLLFNLYLLDRGFDEKFLGEVASIMTAGTIVGTFPTVVLARRAGLKPTLLVALIGAPLTGAMRTLSPGKISILASSFCMGMIMSIWAVSFAPVVSATTNERNRAFGFSLVSALGIGLGAVAGVLGGRLPGIFQHTASNLSSLEAKRLALLIGCGIAALGAIPITRCQIRAPLEPETRSYPRGRFIWSFCAVLLMWSIATGAFNPFFNAYFAHQQHMAVDRIGFVFSLSQLATLVAVLFAPLVLNLMGQIRGVTAMQAATGLALLCLAVNVPPVFAACFYITYVSFQYMSEPALFTLLMSRVAPGQRSGASALNFLVISTAGSLSALISGAAISRFGYPSVLVTAAFLAIAAALMFFALIREK